MQHIKTRIGDFLRNIKSKMTKTPDPPELLIQSITTINVDYIGFDGDIKSGSIVCNKKIAEDLKSIFRELINIEFPINEISPVSKYNNSDFESIKANNTSCYNFRMVIGSNKMSDHATGNAIDINPIQNPWVHPSAHKIFGREYNTEKKGTITQEVVDIFKKYGFSWGGHWKNPDYQHFFKVDNELKDELIKLI